ncbi:tRNA(Cytosine32)-2-thiocytidine synthetase [Sandaracinus amylolyticus]|uniref:tRNA(Cytosine32)-2-thiocytidine synthetase n=2 Tax=Sandaracinus amylolyticus TaxID=927083 RepID=A0A0F6W7V0_9BACT|nr:tRNA(Cytosine32)-2-thiocytidine synthetase [Sandaracinus amylolyticus]
MEERRRVLEKHLYRTLKTTCERWELLRPGERVMVAISGGKDSYTLLTLLDKLVPRLPFSVELVAVHLDQAQPGYDGAPLEAWLAQRGKAYEILREDTYSEVLARTAPGGTYCTVCSRLRRGILYSAAERLGCSAIALGHHRDDALETFLMNLFFAGKMQAMPASYVTDDGRFRVIRPLIECDEARIAEYAALEAFPILPCNLCGSQEGLQREKMSALLAQLEAQHPDVRSVMMRALGNVRPTHLLDPEVLEAWRARPEHVRPERATETREARYEARAVRKLPVVE